MSSNDPVRLYRETQIKTANQIKLIVMLYDGAIRHVTQAVELAANGHRSYDEMHRHLTAAQDIIGELQASLDFDQGGELARSLYAIYAYCNRRLLEANLAKDPAPMEEVRRHLGGLREAWHTISTRKGLAERQVPAGGVNIAS